MKIFPRALITIALLAVLSAPILADAAANISVTTLPNGMKVIIREGHAINLAAVDIWIKAGGTNETTETAGISHFVEHMIFKATAKYDLGQIDREIEGLGAELNGGTSRDYVHFYTTVASEYLPTAVEALADAVMNAKFRPEDMDKERQVILDEIARSESDPSRHALDLFHQVEFETHPYRLPPEGLRESINKLTRDDLAAYYNRYYTPANTCVIIAGDVSWPDALALVSKAFTGFDRPTQPAVEPPEEPAPTSPRIRRFPSSSGDAYVVVGYRAARASEFDDVCALDVILALLGDTYRGRMSSALSASGIRFSKISTENDIQRHPSVFCVLVSVNPEDTDKVIPIILSELSDLAVGLVTEDELVQAKRLVQGGDLFDQETFAGQARSLGLYESVASYDMALKYGATVGRVTRTDIMNAASKYFLPDRYCVTILEPACSELACGELVEPAEPESAEK